MRNLGKHLAKAIKEGRLAHRLNYSQNEIASQLKLSGQTISNLERGLCSLNIKHVIKLSVILEIPLERLKRAMVQDYEDAINAEIWKIMDADRPGNGVELRETDRRGSSLSDSRVYDRPMPSGRYAGVSG